MVEKKYFLVYFNDLYNPIELDGFPNSKLLDKVNGSEAFFIEVIHDHGSNISSSSIKYPFGDYYFNFYNNLTGSMEPRLARNGWILKDIVNNYDSYGNTTYHASICDNYGISRRESDFFKGRGINFVLQCIERLLEYSQLTDWDDSRLEEVIELRNSRRGSYISNGDIFYYPKSLGETNLSMEADLPVENPIVSIKNVKNEDKSNEDIETNSLKSGLKSLIGLSNVKKEILTLINLMKIRNLRAKEGLPCTPSTLHLVFSGNPGTGKTTVARILAKEYQKIGLLTTGQLVEVSRSELVGKYIGHTAQNVKEYCNKAIGGVLFIDEAYSLVNSSDNDYGLEAIDTLMKIMEDNRENLVVIVAGYRDKMKDFLDSNPGLASRFPTIIEFEDYSLDELVSVFINYCSEFEFGYEDGFLSKVKEIIDYEVSNSVNGFGNARGVRNLFERTLKNQANRLALEKSPAKTELITLTIEDLK